MKQPVLPTKNINIPHEVKDTLLHNFCEGRRDYIIFQTGKVTLLRVSDVLAPKRNEIYRTNGDIKRNAYTRDKKAGKPSILYLKPVKQDLIDYFNWLGEQNIQSEWFLSSSRDYSRHVTKKQFYKIMARTGDLLGINYLGTHSMRRTGTYRVYMQTHYSIGLVMSLLDHMSGAMTLKYLGLDQISREKILDEVKSN